jgi:hypothetical protein
MATNVKATGYLHPGYAAALAEFGEPIELPRCQGWLLRRAISGTPYHDAIGCYPLFTCRNRAKLAEDLAALVGDLVSVALVLDPFGDWDLSVLQTYFDRVVRFKEHFVVDLSGNPETFISKHHRYYTRKALSQFHVERCETPALHTHEWASLYANLIRRHRLGGIKAFSLQSFEKQLSVPGLVMLRVLQGEVCIGAHLWFIQGDIAYSHLMALSDAGYALNASYGLYGEAIRMFRESKADDVRYLNIGAGAGTSISASDGLTQFKRGWANASRPVYFCGKVLDCPRYVALCQENASVSMPYFPAYRQNEFA